MGERKSLPGEAILKNDDFRDKTQRILIFLIFHIFRVSSLFALLWCLGHFLTLNSIIEVWATEISGRMERTQTAVYICQSL